MRVLISLACSLYLLSNGQCTTTLPQVNKTLTIPSKSESINLNASQSLSSSKQPGFSTTTTSSPPSTSLSDFSTHISLASPSDVLSTSRILRPSGYSSTYQSSMSSGQSLAVFASSYTHFSNEFVNSSTKQLVNETSTLSIGLTITPLFTSPYSSFLSSTGGPPITTSAVSNLSMLSNTSIVSSPEQQFTLSTSPANTLSVKESRIGGISQSTVVSPFTEQQVSSTTRSSVTVSFETSVKASTSHSTGISPSAEQQVSSPTSPSLSEALVITSTSHSSVIPSVENRTAESKVQGLSTSSTILVSSSVFPGIYNQSTSSRSTTIITPPSSKQVTAFSTYSVSSVIKSKTVSGSISHHPSTKELMSLRMSSTQLMTSFSSQYYTSSVNQQPTPSTTQSSSGFGSQPTHALTSHTKFLLPSIISVVPSASKQPTGGPGSTEKSKSHTALIVGLTVSLTFALVMFIFIVLYYKRRRSSYQYNVFYDEQNIVMNPFDKPK